MKVPENSISKLVAENLAKGNQNLEQFKAEMMKPSEHKNDKKASRQHGNNISNTPSKPVASRNASAALAQARDQAVQTPTPPATPKLN